MKHNDKITCWIVSEGKAGMENQALGVAEILGADIAVKRIALRTPWKQLAPYCRWGLAHCLTAPLTPPWPQLVIASGRQAILPALHIKQASQGATTVVYMQNPGVARKHFDLVITPQHDNLTGANVMATLGAPHRVTPERLASEKEKFPQLSTYPSPRIAVLIGGANRSYRFGTKEAQDLAQQLKKLPDSLLISPSRRTGDANTQILKTALTSANNYFWDGEGENPYFALLAWADAILVTCESVCMVSEACSTGKPVYMIPLPGHDRKFSRFHQKLIENGHVKWFDGQIDFAPAAPLNETALVAQQIYALLKRRH